MIFTGSFIALQPRALPYFLVAVGALFRLDSKYPIRQLPDGVTIFEPFQGLIGRNAGVCNIKAHVS
ncbi:MAG: hypothetical protein ACOC90_07680, partial [Bacteroidota bacterium]